MKSSLIQHIKPLAGVAALAVLSACSSDLTGGNTHMVQLSFTTNATVGAAANRVSAAPNGVSADLVAGPDNELVIQKVQLVFGKIELDRSGDADCVAEDESGDDHPDGGEECEEVTRSPLLVDVPLDDALHPVINIPLPEGTFRELEARLRPARESAIDFNAANPNLVGKSVRVEGTFKGTPFVFTSSVNSKLEMEFDPSLVIDETTKNATVSIDVRRWFLNSSNAVIDPTTGSQSTNQSQIEDNIRRSFHAFEDDDERGEDHHEGHGNGNDDGEHH
jgi:hypothetical protein